MTVLLDIDLLLFLVREPMNFIVQHITEREKIQWLLIVVCYALGSVGRNYKYQYLMYSLRNIHIAF